MTKIAFIGLGNMGFYMALNLHKGGNEVHIYDLDQGRIKELEAQGLVGAGSAEGAAEGAEFIITMLPDGRVVEQVMLGDAGVARTMRPDALHIDMSTILPAQSDAIRTAMAKMGKVMIDAPVGRTATEARSGTLLIMAGAAAEQLEASRAILEQMGDTIIHCGPAGSGIRMKLVNNYMTTVSNVVTAEALTMAYRMGIQLETALQVMRGTAAGRGHMNTTYPDKVLRGDDQPGFMISLARKDLGLGLESSMPAGPDLTTGSAALHVYDQAIGAGYGSKDWTAMLNFLSTKS